jgi:hypothetical protein
MDRARDRAILVLPTALDPDHVRITAFVDAAREGRGLELLAVHGAGDVPRAGLVGEAEELTDDEQQHRENGGLG